MKKILFSAAIMLITSATNAQITEEKIMEDGSVVLVYTPKIFTKEEVEKINRRMRLIATPEYLLQNPPQWQEIAFNGRQRMGSAGASDRIAQWLLGNFCP